MIWVLFLLPTASTSPLAISGAHIHLHRRQAIPDATGNTGNIPSAILPAPPPHPPPITPCPPAPTVITTPTPTPPSSSTLPTTTDPLILTPTPTNPLLSPGTLSALIAGSATAILLALLLATSILRRHRRATAIAEIPIRRSKLGSRLRRRVFNSPPPGTSSRASSRSSGRTLGAEGKDKEGDVRRPGGGEFGEGEMMRVPRAAFMREGKGDVERGAWVGVVISGPRPVRPRSAEPLGRLSGMGMGLGYLR
ncbi:hypothetical protein PMIN06_009711 [Paraphaeosphaeria minitans]|uniref:Uncharacterized protein n=1 Tax=Paraphaeosphaeria minitans TaxID=565426 RepID=A0A9P6G826_9PLEO|nr:hypothetical protein PMIN01_12409 [Paraphaeosphaeria minitans]